MATEADAVGIAPPSGRPRELIDGVLVEKAVGYLESIVAVILARALGDFVDDHDLGMVLGADGPLRILPGQVRVPDVSFIRWDRFPNRSLPRGPLLTVTPDLIVEVLSEGNTPAEMNRKLDDYFLAGVRLVWYVDLRARQVDVFTARDRHSVLSESGFLDGSDVLPGFQFAIADLFARIPKGLA